MDELNLPREVSLEVVYVDEHLMELETVVGAGFWRAKASAYTVPADVMTLADDLLRFAEGGPPVVFTAGADTGIGLLKLRFYRIDKSGHIAGFAQLASSVSTDHRPEQVSRLAVEFGVEAWSLIQFAKKLAAMARAQSGRSSLVIEAQA